MGGMLDGEEWAISVALAGETKEQGCSTLIGPHFHQASQSRIVLCHLRGF